MEHYDFLFRSDTSEDKLEALIELQRAVQALPETRASFTLSNELDEAHHATFSDEMVYLTGSWPCPEPYNSSSTQRYVNPNYSHRESRADIYVECECGERLGPDVDIFEDLNKGVGHDGSCTRPQRSEALERLQQERGEWVRTAAYLWLTQEQTVKRMGIDRRTMQTIEDRQGFDWADLRLQGRRAQVETWIKLRDEYGYTNKEIGEAFGRSKRTVSSYVSRVRRGLPIGATQEDEE